MKSSQDCNLSIFPWRQRFSPESQTFSRGWRRPGDASSGGWTPRSSGRPLASWGSEACRSPGKQNKVENLWENGWKYIFSFYIFVISLYIRFRITFTLTHCITFSYHLPWLKRTRVSQYKTACVNGMFQLGLSAKHLHQIEHILILVTSLNRLNRVGSYNNCIVK